MKTSSLALTAVIVLSISLPIAVAWVPLTTSRTSHELKTRRIESRHRPSTTLPLLALDRRLRASVTLRGGGTHDPGTDTMQQSSRYISCSLFMAYLTVMAAKCALPSTLSSITSDASGLAHYSSTLSRQDVISRLLAFSTVSIAVGKLALGPVIDSIGGISSLKVALTTLFLCLGCIGFGVVTCPTLFFFAGYWILVDFAFSACWAACVKTIRDEIEESRWSKEIGRLAMAARVGNAISFASFAWLLQLVAGSDNARATSGLGIVDSGWRLVFLVSSMIQLIPLTMLHFTGNDEPKKSIGKTQSKSLAILLREAGMPEFWFHLLSRTLIMVLISFLLFIPTYMSQCYGLSAASSARVGSLFALGCLTSVMTLSERSYPASSSTFGYKQKAFAMLYLMGISSVCLLFQYAYLQGMINLSPIMGSISMFIWGFALSIPFYVPSSIFALKRGGNEGSATIADAFDVTGFGMLAVFNSYVARVLNVVGDKKAAWSPVFLAMLIGSTISSTTVFLAVLLEGRNDDKLSTQ